MVAEKVFEQFQTAYLPSLIYRLTKWTYYAGQPVYLLREPNGPTPQTKADLQGICQPPADIRNRCGVDTIPAP